MVSMLLVWILKTGPALWRHLTTETAAGKIQETWQLALADEGPQVVDRVIAYFSPVCSRPQDVDKLLAEANTRREDLISSVGLDFNLPVRSSQVQTVVQMDGYRIEVIRLEVFQGLYLPVNVYIPEGVSPGEAPLVIQPPGCLSSTWTDTSQYLGGNLARMGMVVVVPEGFCLNGSRAPFEGNLHTGYARLALGLPVDDSRYLQEMISAITWAIETYPEVDPERIGVAGYSYGGGMAGSLAMADQRVTSISIPATSLVGGSCDYIPYYDLYQEIRNPDFVYSAPVWSYALPRNWWWTLWYPRYLHTTAGYGDPGAYPDVIGQAMQYGFDLYRLSDDGDRLLYRTDSGDHNYGPSRREDTYDWFAYTLLGDPLESHTELPVELLGQEILGVDITGTRTSTQDLADNITWQSGLRFENGKPQSGVEERVLTALPELFPSAPLPQLTRSLVWSHSVENFEINAYRLDSLYATFPVFVFENTSVPNDHRLLYLPRLGTYQELDQIVSLNQTYRYVASVDYPGVGEVKSSTRMLHSFAQLLMLNDPNLPQLEIDLLRAYLELDAPYPYDISAQGWGPSMYAYFLKLLEPKSVGLILPQGVPEDELGFFRLGKKIPDLLLWKGLFAKVTVTELQAALPLDGVIQINGAAQDTTSPQVTLSIRSTTPNHEVVGLQLSHDGSQWDAQEMAGSVLTTTWSLDPSPGPQAVFARLENALGDLSPVFSDTINLVDSGVITPGLTINDGAILTRSPEITLTVMAPTSTIALAIQEAGSPEILEPWRWEPYTWTRRWDLAVDSSGKAERVVTMNAKWLSFSGAESPVYTATITLDNRPPKLLDFSTLEMENGFLQVFLSLAEDISGVSSMMVSPSEDWAGADWQTFTPVIDWSVGQGSQIFIRFLDRVGNISPTYRIQLQLNRSYLPFVIE